MLASAVLATAVSLSGEAVTEDEASEESETTSVLVLLVVLVPVVLVLVPVGAGAGSVLRRDAGGDEAAYIITGGDNKVDDDDAPNDVHESMGRLYTVFDCQS